MENRGFAGGRSCVRPLAFGDTGRRARSTLFLALGVWLALLGPALAQSDDDAAREHFESGAQYLARSDYENALREFQAAYSLSKRPELLLNIATVYERMGDAQRAVDTLTRYLTEKPDTAERATVESRIENLKKRVVTPTDAGISQAGAGGSSEPAATIAEPAPVPTPAPVVPVTVSEEGPNRTLAFVVLGIGGAAAIGAVVTGLVTKSKFDDAKTDCKPRCDSDTVNEIETLALVTDILGGTAIVGLGVGTVLLLTAGSSSGPERVTTSTPSALPRFGIGIGAKSARAEATWSF